MMSSARALPLANGSRIYFKNRSRLSFFWLSFWASIGKWRWAALSCCLWSRGRLTNSAARFAAPRRHALGACRGDYRTAHGSPRGHRHSATSPVRAATDSPPAHDRRPVLCFSLRDVQCLHAAEAHGLHLSTTSGGERNQRAGIFLSRSPGGKKRATRRRAAGTVFGGDRLRQRGFRL